MAQISVSPVYVNAYERIVRLLAQQGISRVRPYVREVHQNASNKLWDRLSKGSFQQKTSPSHPTPVGNAGTLDRRQSVIATYDAGDVLENEDIAQVITDVESAMVQSMAMAMKRAVDSILIAAATGTSLDGTGATVNYNAAQTIGTGVEIFSFDMVTQVTQQFFVNDVDPDLPKVFFIGPIQLRKLLQLTEATSADYVNVKALADKGYLESWMGYRWVVHTGLTKPTPGTNIRVWACTEKALGLHVAKDIWAMVERDPSISFAWRLYNALSMGATRVEDEHLVQCFIADSL